MHAISFSDTFFDALYRIKPVSKEKGTEQKLAEFSLQLTTDRRWSKVLLEGLFKLNKLNWNF